MTEGRGQHSELVPAEFVARATPRAASDETRVAEPPGAANSGLARLASAAFVLVVLALTFERLFLGVDFGDEATYVALPWRFLLGDRPFVDEINLIQTSGFFTLPLVWAWHAVTGGLDGVVLFLRCAWFAASVLVWLWTARRFAPALGAWGARIVALPVVAAVFLGIPTFSYNTLASGFFLGGLVVQHAAARSGARRTWLAAGVLHGFATVAIPTYLIAALAGLAASLVLSRDRRGAAFVAYAAGGVLALFPFIPFLGGIGHDTFAFGYAYTGGSGAWLVKLRTIAWQTWRIVPHKAVVLSLLGAFVVFAKVGASVRPFGGSARAGSMPARTLAIVALAAVVALLVPGRGAIDSSVHVFLVALLGPFVLPFVADRSTARTWFVGLWLPGFAAGIVAAWTSGNAVANAGFGALPAALVTLAAIASFAREGREGLRADAAAALVPAIFALVLLQEQRAIYLDDAPEKLVARMEEGPFRGLMTTPEKKAWLDEVSAAVRASAAGHERVLAVVHFPLAYLLTDRPPATRTAWGFACPPEQDWDCDARFVADLEHFGAHDVLVVEVRRLHYSSTEIRDQPAGRVSSVLRERFRPLLEREGFSIFVPR
ncbi:MAG: hypothetical protein IPJ77_24235 [Planctomycetes bacterium]|nr:hypothetical protein [Planctomycetota bacterium]